MAIRALPAETLLCSTDLYVQVVYSSVFNYAIRCHHKLLIFMYDLHHMFISLVDLVRRQRILDSSSFIL